METCLVPVIPYKASEFCHGPLASTSSKTPVVLFAVDDKTNAKTLKEVVTYLKDTQAKTYVVTNDKEIADIADMAIMIDESESIYAFYQAAIVIAIIIM